MEWEEEVKRIATLFLSDFYYGERESKRVCEENEWDEKEFSQEVVWYFEDLINM